MYKHVALNDADTSPHIVSACASLRLYHRPDTPSGTRTRSGHGELCSQGSVRVQLHRSSALAAARHSASHPDSYTREWFLVMSRRHMLRSVEWSECATVFPAETEGSVTLQMPPHAPCATASLGMHDKQHTTRRACRFSLTRVTEGVRWCPRSTRYGSGMSGDARAPANTAATLSATTMWSADEATKRSRAHDTHAPLQQEQNWCEEDVRGKGKAVVFAEHSAPSPQVDFTVMTEAGNVDTQKRETRRAGGSQSHSPPPQQQPQQQQHTKEENEEDVLTLFFPSSPPHSCSPGHSVHSDDTHVHVDVHEGVSGQLSNSPSDVMALVEEAGKACLPSTHESIVHTTEQTKQLAARKQEDDAHRPLTQPLPPPPPVRNRLCMTATRNAVAQSVVAVTCSEPDSTNATQPVPTALPRRTLRLTSSSSSSNNNSTSSPARGANVPAPATVRAPLQSKVDETGSMQPLQVPAAVAVAVQKEDEDEAVFPASRNESDVHIVPRKVGGAHAVASAQPCNDVSSHTCNFSDASPLALYRLRVHVSHTHKQLSLDVSPTDSEPVLDELVLTFDTMPMISSTRSQSASTRTQPSGTEEENVSADIKRNSTQGCGGDDSWLTCPVEMLGCGTGSVDGQRGYLLWRGRAGVDAALLCPLLTNAVPHTLDENSTRTETEAASASACRSWNDPSSLSLAWGLFASDSNVSSSPTTSVIGVMKPVEVSVTDCHYDHDSHRLGSDTVTRIATTQAEDEEGKVQDEVCASPVSGEDVMHVWTPLPAAVSELRGALVSRACAANLSQQSQPIRLAGARYVTVTRPMHRTLRTRTTETEAVCYHFFEMDWGVWMSALHSRVMQGWALCAEALHASCSPDPRTRRCRANQGEAERRYVHGAGVRHVVLTRHASEALTMQRGVDATAHVVIISYAVLAPMGHDYTRRSGAMCRRNGYHKAEVRTCVGGCMRRCNDALCHSHVHECSRHACDKSPSPRTDSMERVSRSFVGRACPSDLSVPNVHGLESRAEEVVVDMRCARASVRARTRGQVTLLSALCLHALLRRCRVDSFDAQGRVNNGEEKSLAPALAHAFALSCARTSIDSLSFAGEELLSEECHLLHVGWRWQQENQKVLHQAEAAHRVHASRTLRAYQASWVYWSRLHDTLALLSNDTTRTLLLTPPRRGALHRLCAWLRVCNPPSTPSCTQAQPNSHDDTTNGNNYSHTSSNHSTCRRMVEDGWGALGVVRGDVRVGVESAVNAAEEQRVTGGGGEESGVRLTLRWQSVSPLSAWPHTRVSCASSVSSLSSRACVPVPLMLMVFVLSLSTMRATQAQHRSAADVLGSSGSNSAAVLFGAPTLSASSHARRRGVRQLRSDGVTVVQLMQVTPLKWSLPARATRRGYAQRVHMDVQLTTLPVSLQRTLKREKAQRGVSLGIRCVSERAAKRRAVLGGRREARQESPHRVCGATDACAQRSAGEQACASSDVRVHRASPKQEEAERRERHVRKGGSCAAGAHVDDANDAVIYLPLVVFHRRAAAALMGDVRIHYRESFWQSLRRRIRADMENKMQCRTHAEAHVSSSSAPSSYSPVRGVDVHRVCVTVAAQMLRQLAVWALLAELAPVLLRRAMHTESDVWAPYAIPVQHAITLTGASSASYSSTHSGEGGGVGEMGDAVVSCYRTLWNALLREGLSESLDKEGATAMTDEKLSSSLHDARNDGRTSATRTHSSHAVNYSNTSHRYSGDEEENAPDASASSRWPYRAVCEATQIRRLGVATREMVQRLASVCTEGDIDGHDHRHSAAAEQTTRHESPPHVHDAGSATIFSTRVLLSRCRDADIPALLSCTLDAASVTMLHRWGRVYASSGRTHGKTSAHLCSRLNAGGRDRYTGQQKPPSINTNDYGSEHGNSRHTLMQAEHAPHEQEKEEEDDGCDADDVSGLRRLYEASREVRVWATGELRRGGTSTITAPTHEAVRMAQALYMLQREPVCTDEEERAVSLGARRQELPTRTTPHVCQEEEEEEDVERDAKRHANLPKDVQARPAVTRTVLTLAARPAPAVAAAAARAVSVSTTRTLSSSSTADEVVMSSPAVRHTGWTTWRALGQRGTFAPTTTSLAGHMDDVLKQCLRTLSMTRRAGRRYGTVARMCETAERAQRNGDDDTCAAAEAEAVAVMAAAKALVMPLELCLCAHAEDEADTTHTRESSGHTFATPAPRKRGRPASSSRVTKGAP